VQKEYAMTGDEINALGIIGLIGAIGGVLWLWRRDEAGRVARQEEEDERWVNETLC